MKKTIKKSLAVFMALLMLACTVPMTVGASDEKLTEGYYTYTVENGKASIIDCDESINGDVVIPNILGGYPVKTIGWNAFSDCIDLTSIIIPDSVIRISSWAFSGCTGLTSITIPDSVTSIDDLAFSGCAGLTSITIPNSVESIGSYAFKDCTALTNVTIPNSVTSIGENAFHGCTGLTSITIPDSVTSIGQEAFSYCTSLTSIIVSPGNKVYRSENNCIINTEEKVLVVGCKNSVIPSDGSVTIIGDLAFIGCTGLTSITIPDSVTYIDSSAFYDCTGLTNVTVSPGNKEYHSENNCIINTEEKKLVLGCKNSVIPSDGSVTSIGFCAFEDCTGLTSIIIPDSVTYIGSSAFNGCTGLTSIIIPDSVTYIASSAFYGCTGLTSVTIPNSVKNIGDEAFGYYYDEETYTSAKISDFTIYGYTGTAAETYANENGFTFIPLEDDENEVKNESTGISIIYPDNAYSNDIQLNVSVVTSGSAFNVLNTEKASFKKSLFDISTSIDGETVQPDGTVLVKIPLQEGFNPEKTVVYHVSDDGKLEKMESKIENGYIIFETTHFSFYAIVDETEKEEPVNPPKPENPSNNCSCICHKGGISKFFYKIARFFWKLFKTHKECSCGVMHY